MATLSSEENPVNVLLIGETGVGKTSLVELFNSYGYQIGKEFKLEDVNQFIERRERKDKMESETSKAFSYKINLKEFKLNIVDTPGLVDSRGKDETKNNIKEIITMVQSLDYLNCICLIFNGTAARLTPLIDFVIKEILKLIPSDVLNNVIVIFTKTSDELSLNFELKSLAPFGLQIPKEHSFLIENPFCRWLKAKELGSLRKESKALEEAFADSFKVLDDIIETAKTFDPVTAKKFGELHNIISALERGISDLRLHTLNKYLRQKAIDEAKAHISTKEDLQKLQLNLEQIKGIHHTVTEEFNIVCQHCLKNCHLQCHCILTSGVFGNIRACISFKKSICKICQDPSSSHIKAKFKYMPFKIDGLSNQVKKLDKELKEQKEDLTQDEEGFKDEKEELEEKIKNLYQNLKEFQRIGSNSFIIEVTIKEIQRLQRLLNEIPQFVEETEKIKKIFDETVKVGKDPFSEDDNMKPIRLIWACGMLGIDPNNIQKNDVAAKFKVISPAIRQKQEQYRYYERAKEILDQELARS